MSIIPCSAPNTSVTLWLQQLWALLVKQFLHFVRYSPWISVQIIFIMILAMVLVVLASGGVRSDPIRPLNVASVSGSTENLTMFYAQFGKFDTINFTVSCIHANNTYIHCIWQLQVETLYVSLVILHAIILMHGYRIQATVLHLFQRSGAL